MIPFLRKAAKTALKGVALVRLDFNTEDEWRVEAAMPTLRLLLSRSEKIVVVSHRGRPTKPDKKLSMAHDVPRFERMLGKKVIFIPHFQFGEIKEVIANAPKRSVIALENLRFMSGEAKNDPQFAKDLASLADFYVNEAFAVSHRAAASVDAITRFLPSFAGLGLEQEIVSLSKVMERPKHPVVLVLGGAKAHDKLGIIEQFKRYTDAFLLGGAAGNTLLKMKGIDIKKSLFDAEGEDVKMLSRVMRYPAVIVPMDWVMKGDAILDIGPKTIALFSKAIASARTIVWSGPLGLIEKKPFDKGSLAIARAITRNRKAFSVTGGGETVSFLKKYRLDKKFSFISTGGGAMIDFLAGKKLAGIEALQRRKK